MTKLLFIGKSNDPYCAMAEQFVRRHFDAPTIVRAGRGDPWPEEAESWNGDVIVSYLSPFIISETVLARAAHAAINFHPGPPEFPGIGCTNFALYHGVPEYGVTCHHMLSKVDTGTIIAVRRFPVLPRETVFSLTQRCYASILDLFCEVMGNVVLGQELPTSEETWRRVPYRRSELNELGRVEPGMDAVEVARRVRAMDFPNAPGAFLDLYGFRFQVEPGSGEGWP
jgi:methionyl-tRNA formyltransferase